LKIDSCWTTSTRARALGAQPNPGKSLAALRIHVLN
jgi:hypothetical protein